MHIIMFLEREGKLGGEKKNNPLGGGGGIEEQFCMEVLRKELLAYL